MDQDDDVDCGLVFDNFCGHNMRSGNPSAVQARLSDSHAHAIRTRNLVGFAPQSTWKELQRNEAAALDVAFLFRLSLCESHLYSNNYWCCLIFHAQVALAEQVC